MRIMLKRGLEGVIVAETAIGDVDGQKGHLLYRGYNAADLAETKSFEEVAFLLLNGELPTSEEHKEFETGLIEKRSLPKSIQTLMHSLPLSLSIMDVLRTCVSSLNSTATWPLLKQRPFNSLPFFQQSLPHGFAIPKEKTFLPQIQH